MYEQVLIQARQYRDDCLRAQERYESAERRLKNEPNSTYAHDEYAAAGANLYNYRDVALALEVLVKQMFVSTSYVK